MRGKEVRNEGKVLKERRSQRSDPGSDLRPSSAGVWCTVSGAAISRFPRPFIHQDKQSCLVSACGWAANSGFLRGQGKRGQPLCASEREKLSW